MKVRWVIHPVANKMKTPKTEISQFSDVVAKASLTMGAHEREP